MARAPAFELCSVDVWDTLLRRRCHPDAVKLHVANVLLERAGPQVASASGHAQALLKLRLRVEAGQARASRAQGFDDEYALAEVLDEWLLRAAPGVSSAQRATLLRELAEEEWRHEAYVSYADPGIAAVLERIEARRWMFVSDFYMPAERLFALLHTHGLAQRFADGVSSCELKLNKRSGRLFRHLHETLHVAPAQHCHVGDHAVGDVAAPRKLGMTAVRYAPAGEARARRERERWLGNRRALFRELEHRCAALKPELDGPAVQAWRYGTTLAPLFAGFAQFIAENTRRERPQRLLFCTREGDLFARAYGALAQAYPRRFQGLPAPERFEVSREATFAASLAGSTVQDMQRLWRAFPQQSLEAWALSLGLAQNPLEQACARLGVSPQAPAAQCSALLGDAPLRAEVEACRLRRRAELEAYLATIGLPAAGSIALVDIGWRGSILDNLARLKPALQWRGHYLGLQEFLGPQPANAAKSALGPDLNRAPQGARLFRNLPLLELLCLAPGGAVTGYSRDGSGAVCARRAADPAEDAAFHSVVKHVQDGAIAGVSAWAPEIHAQALSAAELRAPALARWEKLLAAPPRFLRRALAQHKHDERFGRGRFGTPAARRNWLQRLLH